MALSPQRTRFEAEQPRVLQTLRPIPLLVLTTSYQTVLTARTDADFLISHLYVCETSNAARTVNVCLVPPAGSPGTTNALLYTYPVTAYATEAMIGAIDLVVPPGYTIQALGSANTSLNIYVWGYDLTGTQVSGGLQ